MDNKPRRFSTIKQLNPTTFKVIDKTQGRLGAINDDVEDGEEHPKPYRKQSLTNKIFSSTVNNLALFKDDDDELVSVHGGGTGAAIIGGYTVPGPKERASSERKKANLGVMLGVFLPTIQHILGVTMFIRLFWVVGVAGVGHSMVLLLCCCSCTFLTSISLSAVSTNGVIESGGAYFMISRNLGAEFGSAVGILFYLANTVATSMYLVGGVEVLLLYIFPELTLFGGEEVHSDTGMFGLMSHNYRIYGTALLFIQLVIVAVGVRFVQLLAPVSLLCVILSLLACFGGGVEKALAQNGQHVCMLNEQLLPSKIYMPRNVSDITRICEFCNKSDRVSRHFCTDDKKDEPACIQYTKSLMKCENAFPGYNSKTLLDNFSPQYMLKGESKPGYNADGEREVAQDATTTFFILMAIYFPAVTGIMTGTNMSGDLKDPQKSIPSGTITATLFTSFIYFGLALLFGSSIIGPVLRDKNGKSLDSHLVVASLSWPSPWLVIIGSFLSTVGAALQCLCSAPRLLQSIAKDDVIPMLSPFARVTKNNEPFLGLLLTCFIAWLAILLGAVDAIAEVLDFFFLMCYAFVNLICALHSLLGAPNWRPRFKYYHWSLSLMGAGLCFFIMFASHWLYALIAIGLTLLIYKYVEWKGAKKEWGDGFRGLALTTAQYSLLKVEDKDLHPKNWRPQLLILIDGKYSKEIIDLRSVNLLNLAGQLKAGRGLAIVVAFIKSSTPNEDRKRSDEIKERIQQDMANSRLRGFGKALFYLDFQIEGCVSALYQSVGIGGLRPNTVLLNFPKFSENEAEHIIFAEQLLKGIQNENCVIICKGITDFPLAVERLIGFIDIWWILNDGGILMLIAYLLHQHKVWKGCKLRIFVIAEEREEEENDRLKLRLQRYIYNLRIDASVFIINMVDPDVTDDAVQRTFQMEQKNIRFRTQLSNGCLNYAFAVDDTILQNGDTNSSRISKATTATHESSFIRHTLHTLESDSASNITPNGDIDVEKLDSFKIEKMKAAILLNRVILEYSTSSQLVLMSLPSPPKTTRALLENYIAYVEALTEDLPRVMLIGGTGKEVITVAS